MNLKKFYSPPFLILCLFILTICFGQYVPLSIKENIYSLSLLIKDVIIFTLPILIFSFVLSGIIGLKNESVKVILILIPLVCLSNFSGFWASYIFAMPVLKSGIIVISELKSDVALSPAWICEIPKYIRNDFALLSAACLGLFGTFSKNNFIKTYAQKMFGFANILLKKVISPILPMFIIGFIVKMQYEGTLFLIMKEYSILLAVVAFLSYGYMLGIMFLLSRRNWQSTVTKFKNLLPSVLVGLFSMSSAAAIPATIQGSEKNLDDKNIARFIVPATANMHLLGDCFALPVIGMAIMISFGHQLPSFGEYFIFSLYGVVAKFAAAGIPGGSALIFVPIFQSIFGFSAPMLTAVTAIYILFDPIATSSNVFGHGMFAILFEKVLNKFKKKRI